MYYVYEWYIKDTNEVIYVGKGTKNRYKVKKHNRFFNDMIKRFDCSSRIIKEFNTEKEAFEYEYTRVNELKTIGQCVCNIYQGGTGGTTSWWNEEYKKMYSEKNVMKSEAQRKRMSKHNPMNNPDVSKKVASKKSRAVIIGDKEYSSIKEAANELNTYYDTIRNWCRKGINSKGEKCRFKDSEQVIFVGGRYNKGGCRSLTYLGKSYETPKDLADETGLNPSTILKWLKNGFDSKGNPCRYDDDNTQHFFKPNRFAPKAVIVNGVRYSTISEAAKANNVCVDTIRYLLKGVHKSNKLHCEYDNQQPSQGKSDNSTLEGSTTNE